jgi:paraquat-inducible protein B
MSIISLVLAPIIEGKGDWPAGMWYYGFIPLVVMLIGTYLVYHFFWRHGIDITQDIGGGKDVENDGGGEEKPITAEGVEVGAEGDVKE